MRPSKIGHILQQLQNFEGADCVKWAIFQRLPRIQYCEEGCKFRSSGLSHQNQPANSVKETLCRLCADVLSSDCQSLAQPAARNCSFPAAVLTGLIAVEEIDEVACFRKLHTAFR